MWKKVIAEEAQKQGQGTESVHLNNVAEPILAIHEEEEEPGSREELVEGEDPEVAEEEPEWSGQEGEVQEWKRSYDEVFQFYPVDWLLLLPAHHIRHNTVDVWDKCA